MSVRRKQSLSEGVALLPESPAESPCASTPKPHYLTPLLSRHDKNDFDSLNYERIVNQFFIQEQKKNYSQDRRRFFGYTGKTATRWILTVAVGVTTACIAKGLIQLIDILSELRTHKLNAAVSGANDAASPLYIFALYACWNMGLAVLASALVLFVSPQAKGSGIPEIKAYLNGTHIPFFLSFRCFFVTLVGTVLSVSSGLVVGPEGPLVHLGAVLGSSVTRSVKNIRLRLAGLQLTRRFRMAPLTPFSNDSDRRDFISIGVAAGFAAAFGAPIGGVLFSLEEASTFWSGKLMWRALTAAALACLMLKTMSSGHLNSFGLISLQTQQVDASLVDYTRIAELPAFAALGVMGGLLGALFNTSWRILALMRPRTKLGRLAEVAAVSLATSFVLFFLTLSTGTCSASRDDWISNNFELQFNCEDGEFNELASIVFSVKERAIKEIIYDPTRFRPITLFAGFMGFFPLQLLAFGTTVPSGIFLPTILVGCTLGGMVGSLLSRVFAVNAGSYALMGAVALLGGIQRTTISLCVIMMEGTQQAQYLLSIIFTTVVANYIGNYFNEGVYDMALHLTHTPFLEHHAHHQFHLFQARHCMTENVQQLHVRESVLNVVRLLSSCAHTGFPVVSSSGKFIGFILRDQLYTLLESLDFGSGGGGGRVGSDFMQKIQVPSVNVKLQYEAVLEGNLWKMEEELPIDLEPAMNIGPLSITPDCPLSRAYDMFCTMGLRHLVVVDHDHRVAGIISRKDLLRAAGVIRKGRLSVEEKEAVLDRLQAERRERDRDDVNNGNTD